MVRKSHKKSAGFTLVELLVVIGIIALLISVLLPSLSKARQQAELVACMSNMRSMAQSVAIYQAENKGCFPPSATTIDPNGIAPNYGQGTHWNGHIWTKLKLAQNNNIRSCPTVLASLPAFPWGPLNFVKGAFATYQYSVVIGGMEPNSVNGTRVPTVNVVDSIGTLRWIANPYRSVKFSTDVALFADTNAIYKIETDFGNTTSDRGGLSTRLRCANISGGSCLATINGVPRQIFIGVSPVHKRKPTTAVNKTIATTVQAFEGISNIAYCDGSVRSVFFRQGENGLSTTFNAGIPYTIDDSVGNGWGMATCQVFLPGTKYTPALP